MTFSQILLEQRKTWSCLLPSRMRSSRFVEMVTQVLFPQLAETARATISEVDADLNAVEQELSELLNLFNCPKDGKIGKDLASKFMLELEEIHRLLLLDAEAIYSGDPAAENLAEVIVAYPGFYSIAVHRVANFFYKEKIPVFPRLLAEHAHARSGIDIHPGATIGESFCIDHGTGVVIGETAVIGNKVKLYQGVTLGALSVEKRLANVKRHPTIEDEVIVYSNATILGGETVVGAGSVVGGNVWLTKSVPAGSTVYHNTDVVIRNAAPDWSI